eukprot:SM000214S06774  [mRNA]  locus=s214:47891:50257:- [translate_table: standard]
MVLTGSRRRVVTPLLLRVLPQAEFYFSDQNLPTDNFLMSRIKADPEGYVNVWEICQFRKMKEMLKEVPNPHPNRMLLAAVGEAFRASTVLSVSQDGRKVRRSEALQDADQFEIRLRTVVAENLPADHSIVAIEELFSRVGRPMMVRICRPDAANGANQTMSQQTKSKVVVSNKASSPLHALVEMETLEQAERAVAELTDKGNWRSGLSVRLLMPPMINLMQKKKKPFVQHQYQQNRGRRSEGEEEVATMDNFEDGSTDNLIGGGGSVEAGGQPGDPEGQSDGSGRGRGRGGGRGRGRGRGGQPAMQAGAIGAPPVQQAGTPEKPASLASYVEGANKPPPAGPRTPDGTTGFTMGRGRAMPAPTAPAPPPSDAGPTT